MKVVRRIANGLLLHVIVCVLYFKGSVLCLRLTRLHVPKLLSKGSSTWLNCSYDLQSDQLYSIQWYHNGTQFYRFVVSEGPKEHKSLGIYLDPSKSFGSNVFLWETDLNTEGVFSCEVSAEAPSFQTLRKESKMKIYRLSTGSTRDKALFSFLSSLIFLGNRLGQ